MAKFGSKLRFIALTRLFACRFLSLRFCFEPSKLCRPHLVPFHALQVKSDRYEANFTLSLDRLIPSALCQRRTHTHLYSAQRVPQVCGNTAELIPI